ncbi:MAG: hypothetical protein WBN40_08680 [Pseudomonadales bacterium]
MNKAHIERAMRRLSDIDADVARAYARIGAPRARQRPQGFATFMQTIVSQQVSTAAANTIYRRVEEALEGVTAEAVLQAGSATLRSAGMSERKSEYALGLAESILDGTFPIDSLKQLSLEDAIAEITSLRGFGRWSAEIYCMFSLRHQDVFPADDLALLNALTGLKKLQQRPTPKQARELTAHWSPFRSTGSLFLWHWYHDSRSSQ